ncbi:hypothetical protein AKJ52_00420 [candidate division MSBL1 archaeon SCGC-AAA382C18]|uniref:ABC transporter domain-containing protein n=1 Tax=candidate division MSBL1 archaeon SCGC-AAA382C18 TaxID=1698281 RepID=A0A133VLN1_9EURY|nr:hypothetical protein AKJ52_00420 [candidate division MSBL1 archaeon SCGC-AAA382C18]
MDTSLLELKGITKRFGSLFALKDVDFEISAGEAVGLVGNNGAGKSTLAKIITGNHQPTSGEIFWQGEKINISSIKEAREIGIEIVYQDQAVAPDVSVAENIFITREPMRSFGPISAIDWNKMKEESKKLTERLGLNVPCEQEIRFCSGGERQGVAIARAMYFDADLVILDEPTTAMSVKASEKILGFVRNLIEDGISIIYITHNLEQVYPVVKRFLLLNRGEKALDCSKSEIKKENLREKLVLAE